MNGLINTQFNMLPGWCTYQMTTCDISLLHLYVNFIGRHHGRRGPTEPTFFLSVSFVVIIDASFTYSELNITYPEHSFDIVACVPAENPIRAIVCD
jgi:hypothetical protein